MAFDASKRKENNMQPLNKYTKDLRSIKPGAYVTDGRNVSGIVKTVDLKSLPWGIQYIFTLESGKKIVVED